MVFGGGDYQSLLPPHSYINALDYESPRGELRMFAHVTWRPELGLALQALLAHPAALASYFAWRPTYNIHRCQT